MIYTITYGLTVTGLLFTYGKYVMGIQVNSITTLSSGESLKLHEIVPRNSDR